MLGYDRGYDNRPHPTASTLAGCQKACEFDPSCVAVDWSARDNLCYIIRQPVYQHHNIRNLTNYELVSRCNITSGQWFDNIPLPFFFVNLFYHTLITKVHYTLSRLRIVMTWVSSIMISKWRFARFVLINFPPQNSSLHSALTSTKVAYFRTCWRKELLRVSGTSFCYQIRQRVSSLLGICLSASL